MRKVKITKQQTVNPKAVYMGLSVVQIIIMAIGVMLAIGTLVLFNFVLGLDLNITMSIVFVILVVFAGFSIIRINGMNLFAWIKMSFQSPVFRPYQSKGAMDKYEIEEKEAK